ncbi:MAG: hypothetical protein MJA31_16095 [Clostridia bacterium]|nr:hypothetical protein [Clostridia bacterium]
MFDLIKYEFIKKYRMFMVVCITTIIAGIAISIRFGESGFPLFSGLLAVGLFVLYAVDIVMMYSQDINKKTGYMIFMTPNSGYAIIASKVITALLEGLGMLVFFILAMTINGLMIFGPGELFEISFWNIDIPYQQIVTNLFIILTTALLFAIQFLLTIYSAITIRKSVLSNVKFKGLISFAIFLLLNYVIEKIYTIPYEIMNLSKYEHMTVIPPASEVLKVLTPLMLTSIVIGLV